MTTSPFSLTSLEAQHTFTAARKFLFSLLPLPHPFTTMRNPLTSLGLMSFVGCLSQCLSKLAPVVSEDGWTGTAEN